MHLLSKILLEMPCRVVCLSAGMLGYFRPSIPITQKDLEARGMSGADTLERLTGAPAGCWDVEAGKGVACTSPCAVPELFWWAASAASCVLHCDVHAATRTCVARPHTYYSLHHLCFFEYMCETLARRHLGY
jgi:hypothetical protein